MIVGGLGFLALLGLGGTGAMAFLWMKARKGAAGGVPASSGSALPAPAE
jgi:hypothetical protein